MPQLRDDVVAMLRDELVGPARHLPGVQTGIGNASLRNEEILRAEDPPRVRYGAGILFPSGAKVETQEDVGEGNAPDEVQASADIAEASALPDQGVTAPAERHGEAVTDLEVSRANQFLPSALGLTALVRVPNKIDVRVSAATYEKVEMKGRGWTRKAGREGQSSSDSRVGEHGWWRRPIEQLIAFSAAELLALPQAILERSVPGAKDLVVHVFARRPTIGGTHPDERIITITLINRTRSTKDSPQGIRS